MTKTFQKDSHTHIYIYGCVRETLRPKLGFGILTFLYVPYTFRIRSSYKSKEFSQKLYVPIRSVQPSRYSCKLLYVPIRSVYAPIRVLIQKERSLSKVIRSYTFCATLSQILRILLQSYTFLYVPCNPLAILANCIAKSYVPIRYVQPSRDSCESCCKVIRSYTFRASLPYFLKIGYFPIRPLVVPYPLSIQIGSGLRAVQQQLSLIHISEPTRPY